MLHQTVHSQDTKMQGISSISTSPLLNKHCLKRCNDKNSVCGGCYSIRTLKIRKNLANCLAKNHKILSEPIEPIKLVSESGLYRFESFGGTFCEEQVTNYINLCRHNNHLKFGYWVKNIEIVNNVLDSVDKPNNLQINYSSWFYNMKANINQSKMRYVDRIFTVYKPDYIMKHDIEINCNKKCHECRICYTKNDIKHIKEKKK